jgi:2-keto-4-pentenoate hydratase/2-oxohepta-3-ene-1,7-dioic acid hydratase in catechol pathway
MRIVRFSHGNQVKYGVIKDNVIHSLSLDPFSTFESGSSYEYQGKVYPLDEVRLLAPCLPSKVVCLGLNYRPHAQEFKQSLPDSPILFIKPSTAVIGPGEAIVLPRNYVRVDYEGELGVVIGKKARFVSKEKAQEYILGYTCVNDVTEREFQKIDGQWTRSKGFDTFAPIGPWIETRIETEDLKIETYLNGELRQSDRTSELIFGVSKLVEFISDIMTLLPGDIIATGTPAGVGPMKPGDLVKIKIEKIGTLSNPVTAHIKMSV